MAFICDWQSLPDGYIPEPPPIPVPEVASPSEVVLNALGEPTFSSIGLAHWTPPGLVQSALEMMHVAGDLPWWGAIVAGEKLINAGKKCYGDVDILVHTVKRKSLKFV